MKLQKNSDRYNFKKANECGIILIPEIVELLRMQSFFLATRKLTMLISKLNIIASEWVDEEFLLILRYIMMAQEEQDYVLLADVLEGDLLPLLQKLQLEQLEQIELEENSFWDRNLEQLENQNKILAEKMKTLDIQNTTYVVSHAINGQPTLKCKRADREFCMHSTLDPHREAELFARKYVQSDCRNYCIFGMGLGYHILSVLQESKRNRVIVLEYDLTVIYLALKYQDFSTYLQQGRLQIIWNQNPGELLRHVKSEGDSLLLVRYPSLLSLPEGEEKTILENYFVSSNSMLEQKKLLDENFLQLQDKKLPECSVWKEKIKEKDVVIVAGGPSVDAELQILKKYQEEFVILTVGTTARKLINYGIVPDAIIISDPQEHMYRQIEGLNTADIPLFLLSTASADIVEYYKGEIYLVYQMGYTPAEQKAEKHGYTLFQTGGSVTTLALDIAIQFQAKRIILIGTDMAYTNHQSHGEGIGRTIGEEVKLRKVESVDGSVVEAPRNLDIYRKWIEKRLKDTHIPVYNTAYGARIHGTIENSLKDIVHH